MLNTLPSYLKHIFLIAIVLISGFTKGFACNCLYQNIENEIELADLIFQEFRLIKRKLIQK